MYKRGGIAGGYPWAFKFYSIEGKGIYYILSMYPFRGMVCGQTGMESVRSGLAHHHHRPLYYHLCFLGLLRSKPPLVLEVGTVPQRFSATGDCPQ